MSGFSADTAVTAAGAALWTWAAEDAVVAVQAAAGGRFAKLDGVWRIETFLDQLDGLARGAVSGRLRNGRPGEPIDVQIVLAGGDVARFVGSFSDVGAARGLILSAEGHETVSPVRTDVEPVFQPIRRLDTLEVAGFEALARFRHKDHGLAGPDLLASLGEDIDWTAIAPAMVRKSAAVLNQLRAAGRDVFMQVNLSAVEIGRPALVAQLADIIRAAGLPFGVLRIELTEQAALRDSAEALGALSALRGAGAGLVLDDFGAGHSSFAWLAELPADGVKFDPKLVRMAGHPRADAILEALAGLVHGLGMTVTAEGVEDADMAQALAGMGCDYVQGFAYDLPLQAGDLAVAFGPVSLRT